jgi:predicted DNA-binding antitoxin AbrB/MazE fold protein
MSQTINATFADGVLKPDLPLHLPPNARVRLVIEPLTTVEEESTSAWRDLEGLWNDFELDSGGPPPSREQLHDRR